MTSIVLLTYNQLEDCTKSCIESIYKYTDIIDFELIIVDNNSQDGTQKYLKKIKQKYANMQIILNSRNKGYSAGNNDGIKASNGEYVILLNNDTLVSENWLEQILKPFQNDEKIGMVGPVSNSVGNEQKINIDELNDKNYNKKIYEYITDNKDVVTSTQRLGFFCVAIKKKLIDYIGLLDEKFGIGMFEDDDYCYRAIKANYKIVITDGCFIYHKGSVSFKKLTTDAYIDIFTKNKSYFLEKHGAEWSFGDMAFAYWNKFNNDLMDYKLNSSPSAIRRIFVRFEDLKNALFQMREVELKKSNITQSVTTDIISKTKWQIRFKNIQDELIFSTFSDKKKYLKRIYSKFFGQDKHRLSFPKQKIKEIKALSKCKKIIIFPPTIDYSYMKQRPQHLADEFSSKGYFVIYAILSNNSDKIHYYNKINENMVLINEVLIEYLKDVFSAKDVIYYCLWPNNKRYIKDIPHSYLIYDYMDELDLLELDKQKAIEDHNYLLENSNLITVSAKKLYQSIPNKYLNKALLLKNAVDDKFISEIEKDYKVPNDMRLYKNNYKKIVGYYGAIAPWVDFTLIENALEQLPEYAFVFIGPVFNVEARIEFIKEKYDNIFFIKEMKREYLMSYLTSFDICMIPFIKNNITDSVSPVKIYEYIVANKPVITTNILECEEIGIVDVANTKEEFVEKLISHKNITHNISSKFIENNRWGTRIDEVIGFINKENG